MQGEATRPYRTGTVGLSSKIIIEKPEKIENEIFIFFNLFNEEEINV